MLHSVKHTTVKICATALFTAAAALACLPTNAVAGPAGIERQSAADRAAIGRGAESFAPVGQSRRTADYKEGTMFAPPSTSYQLPDWINR